MSGKLNAGLPLIQDLDLTGKVVLARVDHNVVEKGVIKDAFRIDSTLALIYNIAARGGFPILMTHVGRTRDKKTGHIKTGPETSVAPIVDYLNRKLAADFRIPKIQINPELGIEHIDAGVMAPLINDLKNRKISGIYLPNTRWFAGEESKDEKTAALAKELASLADIYVNDAFGSWQPHASTYDVAAHLPSAAGFLLQKEIHGLDQVLNPKAPFLAVVAGSKYDTKIGPLTKIYEKVDHLILGGVIYNGFLAAKYGLEVAGVSPEDVELAKGLVELDRNVGKILEPGFLVESKVLDRRDPAECRVVKVADFKPGQKYAYFLDVAPESFDAPNLAGPLAQAETIFVNAVMGFTPNFSEGSTRMYSMIGQNAKAKKLFGGGDTLTELKNLTPSLYLNALDDQSYYFFTGGGTVLTAIEQGTPYGLKPVEALMKK